MRIEWRSHRELAELAERQHGVVSVRQLIGPLGYSKGAVGRAVRSGRLHRLHQGVYAVGHLDLSQQGRCLAAVLACGPEALLSHHSAAWLWGIRRQGAAPYEVTTPIPRRRKAPRIVVHYSRCLTATDRSLVEGVPVTAVPRLLLDLAASDRRNRLSRDLERAEERGLLDATEVGDLLDRTVGHHGHARLRRALALYRPPPFTRSQFERRFLEAVLAAGLPRPRTNFVEAGFELDLYWPQERFAVELDTYATHGTHGAFERDRLRQEELLLLGIGMTRVTDVRFVDDPRGTVERVARLLAQRRH